jgi:hypothetical protein
MRQQFSYNGVANVIPPSRLSTVAKNMLALPIFAAPNVAGSPSAFWGPVNNFSLLSTAGGSNDQITLRGDENLTSKQTAFERYTWWKSKTLSDHPWGNGQSDNNVQPDDFTTQQAVVGDTYVFNPNSILDVRLSYLNWNYYRTPPFLGLNEATTFGWPSYMNFGALNGFTPSTGMPELATFFGAMSYTQGAAGLITGESNDYAISATYEKIWRKHTFKFGLDLRRYDLNYYQTNFPGGVWPFDMGTTAGSNPGFAATGSTLASMELGYLSDDFAAFGLGEVGIAQPIFQRLYYQGYFAQDSWVPTNKLTLTLGLRYEVPGEFLAGHGWNDTFNPTETNSVILADTGLSVPGAFDLVNSSQHPNSGTYTENWDNWSPRLGAAYRLTEDTVVRAGWGKFVVPEDLYFGGLPLDADINSLQNVVVGSINGEETPNNYQNGVLTNDNTLDNPFPNGMAGPPHRNSNYQQILLGGGTQANTASQPNGETYQWNVAVEHQFPLGIAVTASYVGLKGEHLPIAGPGWNSLPDSVVAQAAADPNCSSGNFGSCFLLQSVNNPYYPYITQGALGQSTITANQLLRPFPEYSGIGGAAGNYVGISDYNALQMTVQKRMSHGGTILGSYTFGKQMTNAETVTTWLDTVGGGAAGLQDYNNLKGEDSLSSFDLRQSLVVSYVYPLPIGHGQLLLPNLSGAANVLIGGWGLDGISSFQEGFPLGMTVSSDPALGDVFQGTQRPNAVAGCAKKTSGSIYNRLGGTGSTGTYFNTACYTQPSYFAYGNESRTDNTLRTPGVANWDMALFKTTTIHENTKLSLRIEAFNLFNRVQFAVPDTGVNDSTFGWISSTANNPRILQIAGRFTF